MALKRADWFLAAAIGFVVVTLLFRDRATAPATRLEPYSTVTTDGTPLRSADQAGKLQLINIWASWCGPCREELPKLDSLAGTWDTSRVVFAALSDDLDGAAARQFLHAFSPLPHLRVGLGLGALKTLYRYPGLPLTMLVDTSGTIVRSWYGYGGPPQLVAIDSILRRLDPGAKRPAAAGGAGSLP